MSLRARPVAHPNPVRQLALFAAVVLLPSIALIVVGIRFLSQEEELAGRRAEQALDVAAREIGLALVDSLDRGLQRLESADQTVERFGGADNVVFLGRIVGEEFRPAWVANQAPRERPEFRMTRIEVERAELVRRDLDQATRGYSDLLESARTDDERAIAHLRLGRTHLRGARASAAIPHLEAVLATDDRIVDPVGIPLAARAVDLLLQSDPGAVPAIERLSSMILDRRWLSPEALYYARDLLAQAVVDSTTHRRLMAPLGARIEEAELALSLARDPASLVSRAAAGRRWRVVGDGNWLVSLHAPDAPDGPVAGMRLTLLETLLPPDRITGWQFITPADEARQGRSVGDRLDALAVLRTEGAPSPPRRDLVVVGLILVIALVLLGGWLLLRDVRREARLSGLRTQFVSSVSHELRTPLTSIRLFAETMLGGRDPLSDQQKSYLGIIAGESERLTRMLNNVLGAARLEQGTFAIDPALQPIAPPVDRALRAVEYELAQKRRVVERSVEPGLPEVAIDADAIEQAVLNLLTNAMKYGGKDPIGLVVAGDRTNGIVIRVLDRGAGVPPAYRERIFERFFRVPDPRADGISGAGLGLALVRHIAEAHGGAVSVEDRPGGGSIFSLHLPEAKA